MKKSDAALLIAEIEQYLAQVAQGGRGHIVIDLSDAYLTDLSKIVMADMRGEPRALPPAEHRNGLARVYYENAEKLERKAGKYQRKAKRCTRDYGLTEADAQWYLEKALRFAEEGKFLIKRAREIRSALEAS